MYENAARNLSINPFEDLESQDLLKVRYYQKISFLAQRFIYSLNDLNISEIEKEIANAEKNPDISSLESENHGLESLLCLLKGIEAHEKAEVYNSAWHAELSRQANPEDLTREQVAGLFDAFKFKGQIAEEEKKALAAYGDFLKIGNSLALNENISLELSDVKILMNDLLTRIAERIKDKKIRKEKLDELDVELADIAQATPEQQVGKRLEIEELYLLRQLIRWADTGHLATVAHSTPRFDLNPKRKSVDLVLSAAGKSYQFQIKAIKEIDNDTIRSQQSRVLSEAAKQIAGTDTSLSILNTDSVDDLFRAEIRGEHAGLSQQYSAFGPLAESLDNKKRHPLLKALGLTEQNFQREKMATEKKKELLEQQRIQMATKLEEEVKRETATIERRKMIAQKEAEARAKLQATLDALRQAEARAALETEKQKQHELQKEISRQEAIRAEFERKVLERAKQEQEMELSRQEQIKREAEAKEYRQKLREEELARQNAEIARAEELEQRRLAAIQESIQRQKEKTESELKKQREIRAKLDEAIKREAIKREAEAEAKREQVRKDAQRQAREAKKQEKSDWPPKTIANLKIVSLLDKMGISPADPNAFIGAKKGLIRLFGDAKKGTPTEADKINRQFKEIFPTKESYEKPSTEKLEQLRRLL
ncbi:MAG: hypothetical protein WCW31_03550 [Patescibacteria group bacterium]